MDLDIESLTCRGKATDACKRTNARWVSVVLRDPALNVYVQTENGWIRDKSRVFAFGKSIVDTVWAEAARAPASRAFAETGQRIDGAIGRVWHGGGSIACWTENVEPCIAAYGLPLGREDATDVPIAGGRGTSLSRQTFERVVLEVNRYPEGTRVEGALLGGGGRPEVPVDARFAGYYARYGALAAFGYPVGPATVIGGRRVQTFERARLETTEGFDPNRSDPIWQVARGHLGRERRAD